MQLAVVTLAHDPARGVEPESGSRPTALVVKNGSRSGRLGLLGDARPVVADRRPRRRSASSAVAIRIVPVSPSASIALSSRFVQTWLSSDPNTHTRGGPSAYVALDRDLRGLSSWARIVDVASIPSCTSISWQRRRSSRVGLDRRHERRHAVGLVAQVLRRASAPVDRRGDPAPRRPAARDRRAATSSSHSRRARRRRAAPRAARRGPGARAARPSRPRRRRRERVAFRRTLRPRHRVALQRARARRPRTAPCRIPRTRRSPLQRVERLGERRRGALCRGGRVVELVRAARPTSWPSAASFHAGDSHPGCARAPDGTR